MSPSPYNVILVNLTPDARSVDAAGNRIERRGVSDVELRALLENFCAIDPVENAAADTEIRVQVRGQSCLLQAGNRKLLYYDALKRDAPGHPMSVDEVMAELDGSAGAARAAPSLEAALKGVAARGGAPRLPPRPAPRRNVAVIATMAIVASLLAAGIAALRFSRTSDARPAGFSPLGAADAKTVRASLEGVYLSGIEPGRHGIVVSATGELRLFQLQAEAPPRLVHARGIPGRLGGQLCIATDQPGGLVAIPDPETLMYCGETYRRVR